MADDKPVDDKPLVLTPPAPVEPVDKERAAGLVPLSEDHKKELEAKADTFITELVQLDAHSPEFGKKVEQLVRLGRHEMREAAGHSNRFLDRPVKGLGDKSGVGADIVALRRTIEDLDPKKRGNLLESRKLFGFLPFGNKMRAYFDEYKSAQSHISDILERLENGKDELLADNAAIDVERASLWTAMSKLEEMIVVGRALDRKLEAKARDLDDTSPAQARALREGPLFSVRQRLTDLLTQMAVSVQGYLALDLVKKNNTELVKGVDRASTTTVSALRTAVTVAQAMTNQKLVLSQIEALNDTTASIIDSTSRMLSENTAQIHRQAAGSTIPIETLQRAFENVYSTMDAIDDFKLTALDSMKTTVDALGNEVERSRGYIARAEGAAEIEEGPDPFRMTE